MKKFRVEVAGGGPPTPRNGLFKRLACKLGNALRAVLLRPRLAIWSCITAFVLLLGTPHVGWDYQCRHDVWGLGTCREALWCEYYGVQGRRVEWPPRGERCELIKILPINWNQLIERITT